MREPLKMYLFVVIAATLGAGCAPRVVGKPVCKRAKILAPCTRDHCGD